MFRDVGRLKINSVSVDSNLLPAATSRRKAIDFAITIEYFKQERKIFGKLSNLKFQTDTAKNFKKSTKIFCKILFQKRNFFFQNIQKFHVVFLHLSFDGGMKTWLKKNRVEDVNRRRTPLKTFHIQGFFNSEKVYACNLA